MEDRRVGAVKVDLVPNTTISNLNGIGEA
jgi:hypothetical protein